MSIPHSTYQRSIDLAGEIKCARDLVAECERAEAIKADELRSAEANTAKQRDNLARLLAEREALAEQARQEVLAAGESQMESAGITFDLDMAHALKGSEHGLTDVPNGKSFEF